MTRFHGLAGVGIATCLSCLAAPGLSGCFLVPHGCTDIGWFEGLTITMIGPSRRPLLDGSYHIAVVADGVPVTLDLVVAGPRTSCVAGCAVSKPNGAGRLVELSLISGGGIEVSLAYGGGGGPAVVAIRVSYEGDDVASTTLTPRYRTDELNGPGCGTATQAEAELTLALPGLTEIPDGPLGIDAGVRDAGL